MSMRISSLLAVSALALSACTPESGAPEGESVACAIGAGADLASDCVLETVGNGRFVIHHRDGSFVRVAFDAQSGLLSITDGAMQLEQTTRLSEDPVEFSTVAARYRIARDLLTQPGL